MHDEMKTEAMELCVTACEKFSSNNEVLILFFFNVNLWIHCGINWLFVYLRAQLEWSKKRSTKNSDPLGTWSWAKASASRSHTRSKIFCTCSLAALRRFFYGNAHKSSPIFCIFSFWKHAKRALIETIISTSDCCKCLFCSRFI